MTEQRIKFRKNIQENKNGRSTKEEEAYGIRSGVYFFQELLEGLSFSTQAEADQYVEDHQAELSALNIF